MTYRDLEDIWEGWVFPLAFIIATLLVLSILLAGAVWAWQQVL